MGEFANEIRLVFKESLEHQIQEKSDSAKKDDIEEDVEEAANDQEKNQPKVENTTSKILFLKSERRWFSAKIVFVFI